MAGPGTPEQDESQVGKSRANELQANELEANPWLVIGVGNAWRGDDAAGLHSVRRLQEIAPAGFRTATCTGGADMLLDLWDGAGTVVVVDAVVSGAEPGTVVWLDASAGEVPAQWFPGFSTHALGLSEAIRLGRVLERMPAKLYVCGIEASQLDVGEKLSEPVRRGIECAVAMVLERSAAGTRSQESADA